MAAIKRNAKQSTRVSTKSGAKPSAAKTNPGPRSAASRKTQTEFQKKILDLLDKVFPFKHQEAEYRLTATPVFTEQGLVVSMSSKYRYDKKQSLVKNTGTVLMFSAKQLEDETACLNALSKLRTTITQLYRAKRRLTIGYQNFLPLVFCSPTKDEAYNRWRQSWARSDTLWPSTLRKHINEALETFPAVEAKFQKVYGLGLPRHLAIYVGFHKAVDEAYGRSVSDSVRVVPGGVLDWFNKRDFARIPQNGLDERLHYRYFGDPPEFVTVALGDTDGLHWGLWYDNTDSLPKSIMHNYARGERETIDTGCVTLLDALCEHAAPQNPAFGDEKSEADSIPEYYPHEFCARLFTELVEDARDWESEVLSKDGIERPPPLQADVQQKIVELNSTQDYGALLALFQRDDVRRSMGFTYQKILGGICPRLPDSVTKPTRRPRSISELQEAYADSALVAHWIAQAWKRLKKGDPGPACVVGRELFWLATEQYQTEAVGMLCAAYELLRRPQLAEILRVHHANRGLQNVDVYSQQ